MSRLKRLLKSFTHAISGLKCVLREQNFQIELSAAFGALVLAAYFCISRLELISLILIILLVLVSEIVNTIFERVIDVLVPRQHPYAKAIKDMMAGAVLLSCLGSIAIGFIIFFPYFFGK